jgi:hypothetical protein
VFYFEPHKRYSIWFCYETASAICHFVDRRIVFLIADKDHSNIVLLKCSRFIQWSGATAHSLCAGGKRRIHTAKEELMLNLSIIIF